MMPNIIQHSSGQAQSLMENSTFHLLPPSLQLKLLSNQWMPDTGNQNVNNANLLGFVYTFLKTIILIATWLLLIMKHRECVNDISLEACKKCNFTYVPVLSYHDFWCLFYWCPDIFIPRLIGYTSHGLYSTLSARNLNSSVLAFGNTLFS